MTLKIVSIILKPVELAMLVVGMGLVAYFTKEAHDALVDKDDRTKDLYDPGRLARYEFYLYSTGVGVAITVLGFMCALGGMLEKKYGALAMAAIQALCTFQLLVSTALLNKTLLTYDKKEDLAILRLQIVVSRNSVCDFWDKAKNREYDYNCSQLTGGVACGFIAMVVFAVDTVISLISFTRSQL